MPSSETMKPGDVRPIKGTDVTIRVDSGGSGVRSFGRRLLIGFLLASIILNLLLLLSAAMQTAADANGVPTRFHSGDKAATDHLAIINIAGTIMPPFTERWRKQIDAAIEDDRVKGVLLVVDSPGGLVADSHQIYHDLQKLKKKKPIYVAMKRLAASGGYYVSMGGGPETKIFVEPTTWTGSIGVIIPRYNASELAERVGVKVEPLTTGPLKDTLSPFRDLTDQERDVWKAIMDDSFDRFVKVIHENRKPLSEEDVRALATGQIYTANQAIENGMADEIGYEEDALVALAEAAGLTTYKTIEYTSPTSFVDVLLGSAQAQASPLEQLLDAATPKALYYCSWNPWVPSVHR